MSSSSTRRLRTLATSTILSLFLSQGVNAQSFTSRGFPGESVEAKIALAESSEPTWFPLAERLTLDEIIDEVCGNQPPEFGEYLRERALELNDEPFPDRPIEIASVVAVPFCHKVEFGAPVVVQDGDGLSQIALRNMGVNGRKTLADIVERNGGPANPTLEQIEDFSRDLKPGQTLRMPYVSRKRVFHAIPGGVTPQAVISEYPPERFELTAALQTVSPTDQTREFRIEPVGFVPATSTLSSEGCPVSGGVPQSPPFELAKVRERLDAERAFLRGAGESPAVAVIGIIDTGLKTVGNDFFDKRFFVENEGETGPFVAVGSDDDGNGHRDDIWGTNFGRRNGEIRTFGGDNSDHGTRMSALLLGGVDFVTALGALEEPLVKVRVVNFSSDLASGLMDPTFFPQAVDYLAESVEPLARIINVSLASMHNFRPIENAILEHREVLFVAAAANNNTGGQDLSLEPAYPARLSGNHDFASNLVTVASHEKGGVHAEHSNWGANVDLHAPGCAIQTVHTDSSVVAETGSSVATAIVSFTAAIIRALGRSQMPPEKIKQRLIAGSDMDATLANRSWTTARLNVVKAISLSHDLIQTRSSPDYLFGHLRDPEALRSFCAEANLRARLNRVLKVIPNVRTNDHAGFKIDYWIEAPPRIAKIRCSQQNSEQSIGTLDGENGATDGPLLSDVLDIVTASLRMPPS